MGGEFGEHPGKSDGLKVQPTSMGLGVAAAPFVTSPDVGQDLLHKQASRLPFVGREERNGQPSSKSIHP